VADRRATGRARRDATRVSPAGSARLTQVKSRARNVIAQQHGPAAWLLLPPPRRSSPTGPQRVGPRKRSAAVASRRASVPAPAEPSFARNSGTRRAVLARFVPALVSKRKSGTGRAGSRSGTIAIVSPRSELSSATTAKWGVSAQGASALHLAESALLVLAGRLLTADERRVQPSRRWRQDAQGSTTGGSERVRPPSCLSSVLHSSPTAGTSTREGRRLLRRCPARSRRSLGNRDWV